eukprot:TRINITY_DN79574_c0_g1_i1.p1 TRINITY_DN79574_c0_g1~~TRINITY_DN79574_c0_g1_i1.p1  ORF type:complete len:194 (+),score=28.98 TRINITY_DN79574_c0_g1_i1:61-642(+)
MFWLIAIVGFFLVLGMLPDSIFFGTAALMYYYYPLVMSEELGDGQWVEESWGWDWKGDPCSCRGGYSCPQCGMTVTYRVFLKTNAWVFSTAALLYFLLCLASFAACSRSPVSKLIRYSQAAAALVASSFALCGAFFPLPGCDPAEPFCRDDDCGSLLLLVPVWLGGLSALVCAYNRLASSGHGAVVLGSRRDD